MPRQNRTVQTQPITAYSSGEVLTACLDALTRAPKTGTADAATPFTAPFIIGVDGRSGSGKSTLTAKLVRGAQAHGYRIEAVRLDGFYPGWDGLAEGAKTWRTLSGLLSKGKPAAYTEWDWHRNALGVMRTVTPPSRNSAADTAPYALPSVIVGEGVGAATGVCDLRILTVASDALRYERAIMRDGDTYRPHWSRWARQEEALFACYSGCYASADIIYRTWH